MQVGVCRLGAAVIQAYRADNADTILGRDTQDTGSECCSRLRKDWQFAIGTTPRTISVHVSTTDPSPIQGNIYGGSHGNLPVTASHHAFNPTLITHTLRCQYTLMHLHVHLLAPVCGPTTTTCANPMHFDLGSCWVLESPDEVSPSKEGHSRTIAQRYLNGLWRKTLLE
ncbi:hypothetical protein BD289DRAFT_234856 [Coniella lustricola]|uniref:Uncharacterized protein n=1 Tax=Coniella lustricola TaxID=2025994 RepID=A0A2T3A9V7_9PEZI|nr:hypothetical protein BD289DRAFT_234856 [Coniella lustricola]